MENKKYKENVVDLDLLIKTTDDKLLKKLPRFVVNILKKIIKQDELNYYHNNSKDKEGIEYVNSVLNDLNVKINIYGGENVPKSGRFVFVANHPQGGIDALAFLSSIARFFPNVVSPSNQLFMYIPNLHSIIVGVNVFGFNSKKIAEEVNQTYESGCQIMIFPSGEVSRKKGNIISDPDWQKSFISKAVQFKRDVVPVFISSKNTNKFYRIANLRKKLGIKSYIETIYLPSEMLKKRNSEINLYFDKPIKYQKFDKTKSHKEWAQYVKSIVYQINSTNNN